MVYGGGDDVDISPENAFAGRLNGLCGAAVAGGMFLVTGLRFGRVALRAEVHRSAPGDCRVRYCARDMQRGHDLGQLDGDEAVDAHLLQL